MPTVQVSARIDVAAKKALDDYCHRHGVVMNHFIREALVDRLEELEDIDDIEQIRREPTRRLGDVLTELEPNGGV